MRTLMSLLLLAGLVVAGITAYNWITGNNDLKIVAPVNGSTTYTNSVHVQLTASDKTRATLSETGNEYQIVTYMDGTEVWRGKELSYDLPNLKQGNHELKVGIADNRPNSINLNIQPGVVRFTVAPVAAAAGSEQYSNVIQSNPSASNIVPEATPVTGATNVNGQQSEPQPAAQPLPTATPAVASLPSAGMGGGREESASVVVNNPNTKSAPVNFNVASTVPAPAETPMQSAFRSLMTFYVAGFVVAFAFIGWTIWRRYNRRQRALIVRNRYQLD